MKVKSKSYITALALAITLPITVGGAPASSLDAESAQIKVDEFANRSYDKELTPEEKRTANELAPVVEKTFEGAMKKNESGQYVFDYNKAKKKLGKKQADEIQAEVNRLAAVEKKNQSSTITPYELSKYTKCVLEKSGYGTLVGLFTGAYKELIEKKLWSEVAKVIVKTVGVNAVKGGVVGLAASLTVSAAWCKWAE